MSTEAKIKEIVEAQKAYFRRGDTLDVKWRLSQLKRLRKAVRENEEAFERALNEDLGRSAVESYLCDIGPLISEINEMIRHLRRWARPETHFSGLMCFPSIITRVYKMPYGVTLIFSPFNFPILLSLGVLAASISAGNTAVIRPSSKTPACTALLKSFIADLFPSEYVTVVDGDHDVATALMEQRFDKVFYTGSPQVGKIILANAAKNLIPAALELGGENGNWCIIRKDADLKDAAHKIAFFKVLNAGQICININQIAIAEEVADEFLGYLKEEFTAQLGDDPVFNDEYPQLINDEAYRKCASLAGDYADRIIFGGKGNPDKRRFSPTIIYPVSIDEPIVCKELFCPLLPVVTFRDDDVESILDTIESREHPLSMYLFTKDTKWASKIMSSHQFGGGCINEVCIHLMVKGVPFNGTGHSGMGAYHGIWGFREFTHPQTVLKGHRRFNLPLRDHPYSGRAERHKLPLLRLFER